jgi:hypothetical protein
MLLAILEVLVMQCHDLALRTSLVVLLVLKSKDLLLHASRAISRVLGLQSQEILLSALLDDAVFFALIIEEFLENFFVLPFVSNCMQ